MRYDDTPETVSRGNMMKYDDTSETVSQETLWSCSLQCSGLKK